MIYELYVGVLFYLPLVHIFEIYLNVRTKHSMYIYPKTLCIFTEPLV